MSCAWKCVWKAVLVILVSAMPTQAVEQVHDIWAHFGSESDLLPITRMDLDVTGDGEPEIFLTIPPWGAKWGSRWAVYSPNGATYLYLGTIVLHTTLFKYESERQILSSWQPIQIGRFFLVEYLVGPAGITEVERQELFESDEAAKPVIDSIRAYAQSESFVVTWASVKELQRGLVGEEVRWKDRQTLKPVAGLRRIFGAPPLSVTKAIRAGETLFEHFTTERLCLPGDPIYLIELEVTGDGTPEILLSNHLRHPRLGWLLYSPVEDGYLYLGSLVIDPGRIRVSEDSELVVLRSEPEEVAFYRIDADGIHQIRTVDWSMNWSRLGRPEREKMDRWRQAVGLRVLTVPFAELEAAPESAAWRTLVGGEEREISVDFTRKVIVAEKADGENP